ncbi:MAG: glycosyltransferase family 4 protein [Methanobacterium sp.]|jgi:glycosyltransferase involved in cell wall biosynthesis|nr:glycosyltransferase family 4 protein [Methanobacterium sp.]
MDHNTKNMSLALFFTVGISLERWHHLGMIDREVTFYNELSKHFQRIYLFTYGNREDLKFSPYLRENIKIIPNERSLNPFLYSILIPFMHRKILKSVDVVKTNQMMGSWSAVLSRYLNKNVLIVRTGYVLSLFKNDWISRLIERFAYRNADGIITSSLRGYDYIEEKYSPKGLHYAIPNYVETERFRPLNMNKDETSLCFVGRLTRQKNLFALIEALKGLPYSLNIIGTGELKEELEKFAEENDCNVHFMGNIANQDLPPVLNKHEIFILPSMYEGMPKTLLEAMSCALPVIGTNVEGIKEVITPGHDGILCGIDSDSISKAIVMLMEDDDLRIKLRKNARHTIIDKYSLKKVFQNELELIKKISVG